MILGTHNSATGGRLVWWLRPLAWVINPTSKCQDKSIDEQLKDGVKLFNLQVAYNGERWYFSHGLALYEEDLIETLAKMKAYATTKEPIYFQLYLDKSFWFARDEAAFVQLVKELHREFVDEKFVMLSAWVEGTNYYPHLPYGARGIKVQERYWTTTWASINAACFLDKLPLPKYHAKKFNARYKSECTTEYLMLDFYEL